jgi:hypothetical protein
MTMIMEQTHNQTEDDIAASGAVATGAGQVLAADGDRSATIVDTDNPEVIVCPDWCERGDEHCGPNDVEHWTDRRHVCGALYADVLVEGGRPQFQLHASDHVTISFMADDVAKLIAMLSSLLAEVAEGYPKRVVLGPA